MGLWGSLVAYDVWDVMTPVQIRAAPFKLIQTKCQQNQKKQNQQEDSEQDTERQSRTN